MRDTALTSTGDDAAALGRLFLLELSGNRIHSMNPDGTDRRIIVTNCHVRTNPKGCRGESAVPKRSAES